MIRWNAAVAVPPLIALLVSATTPAVAAEGLFMTWNDCALGPVARADRSMPCDNNSGNQSLFEFIQEILIDLFEALEYRVQLFRERLTRSCYSPPETSGKLLFERRFLSLQLFYRKIETEY